MKKQSIPGRITVNLVIAIAVTLLSVGLAVWWMAKNQNDEARQSTRRLVSSGVAAISARIESTAFGFAWRGPAYEAYQRGDGEWLADNLGAAVSQADVADLLAIVSPEGDLRYGWSRKSEAYTGRDLLPPAERAAIIGLVSNLPVTADSGRSGFLHWHGRTFVAGVSRLTPVTRLVGVDPQSLPLVVAAIELTPRRLTAMGEELQVKDLRILSAAEEAAADSLFLHDVVTGRDGAVLAWTPPLPGAMALGRLALPLASLLILFSLLIGTTALGARRLAVVLTASEEKAVIAAHTDSLTGLMNRAAFVALIQSSQCRAAVAAGTFAVVFVDVNGFKAVNDSLGHHGGDQLVRALGLRLASVLPAGTSLARTGGDEFVVILLGPNAKQTVAAVAAAMAHAFDKPFAVEGFEFHVTAAIGYALASKPGMSAEELVRRADLAMYNAKNAAEREAVAYHPTMETGALEKKQLEAALRRGIAADELSLAYQPIVRAGDFSVASLEALVRWTSKEYGSIAPSLFVPVAEETGLIQEVGVFVVEQVCKDLVAWPDLTIAINISPVQLRDPNFPNDILAVLEHHGIAPQRIELELTEGILVNNPAIAKRKLQALRDLGFRLSLDDFGTGFSSIGYLRQFPFDRLKVDRSFVREIGVNTAANALMQALVSLGDAMDLDVVAEGIENEDQLTLLRLVQCEFVQGFYVSMPLTAAEITDLLARAGEGRRLYPALRIAPPQALPEDAERLSA